MNIALRPKSFIRFLNPLPTISRQIPRWVSTQTPMQLLTHHLNGKTQLEHSRYEITIVSVLKSCSSSAIFHGQQIHSLAVKTGLNSNTFIRNSLINMYAKCGYIDVARLMFDSCSELDPVSCNIMIAGYVRCAQLSNASQLFDKMPKKGCVSYTTMIMGLAQKGVWIEAIRLFREMMYERIIPNEVTLASVISAYSHLGDGNGGMIHGLVIKLGIESLVVISTNLVHLYCICSHVGDARVLFEDMIEPNIVSWNVMLNGYAKAGQVDLARALFKRMPTKDVVSWGTMIDGYVQVNRLTEALIVYCEMLHTGILPNDIMIVDLISACGRSAAILEGLQIHSTITKMGFDCYDFVQATTIHFYAACNRIDLACMQFELGSKGHLPSWNVLMGGFVRKGMIEQARQVFDEMPQRDVFSWSIMISGYAQNEQPTIALTLFHEMVDAGVEPNEVTMVSVLSAIASLGILEEAKWAHAYLHNNSIHLNDNLSAALIDMYAKCGSVSTALEVFNRIRDKVSSISAWNAIICGLAMHGHANLSLKTFSDLQGLPIKPNSITFIGVLTACCHAGLVEAGEQYFKIMKSAYDIEPTIKHYGCMVDLLGRAGRLEKAEELVRSMPMKADVVIWGTLLAACKTHENVDIGERAAESLAQLDTSHGPSRVLLSNIYADAGRWEDALLIRTAIQIDRLKRSPGYSVV